MDEFILLVNLFFSFEWVVWTLSKITTLRPILTSTHNILIFFVRKCKKNCITIIYVSPLVYYPIGLISEYILDAMQQTTCKTALESLKLQHAHHLKQTDQLYDRQRRAQILQIRQTKSQYINQSTQTLIQVPIVHYFVRHTVS